MSVRNRKSDSIEPLKVAEAPVVLNNGSSISLHLSLADAAFLRHQRASCPLAFLISLGLAKLLMVQVACRIKAWQRNPQARLVLLLTAIDQLCLLYSEGKEDLLKGSDPLVLVGSEPVDQVKADALRGSIDFGLSGGLASAIKGDQNEHK